MVYQEQQELCSELSVAPSQSRAGKLLMLTQGTQRLVLLDTVSFPFHPELHILCVH